MVKKSKVNEFVAALHEIPYLSDKDALERFGFVMSDGDISTPLLDNLHDFERAVGNLLVSIDVANLNRRFG